MDPSAVNRAVEAEEVQKLQALRQKYAEEAAKRYRPETSGQFFQIDHTDNARFRAWAEDPFVDHAALNAKESPVQDGGQYKFVILGAGLGGLVAAGRLIQAGAASGADDIRIIDKAGGFGGTWYWCRFPGLHCDVESYTYLPFLEETGYVPKQKYSSGPEVLQYANQVAEHWNLQDKALFRSQTNTARWDDDAQLWNLDVIEERGPSEQSRHLRVRCTYFLTVTGILSKPQVPRVPGLDSFEGPMFHAARWSYPLTGGTPEEPRLTKLEGKRVGIIGTGPTALQALPQLAKWAKELYVFQRTPTNAWPREQRQTDPEEWKKIANKKGWQLERNANFTLFVNNGATEGQTNMVDDYWTKLPGISAIIGCPKWGLIEPTPEKMGEHIARVFEIDMPASEAARARVDDVVKDPDTAAKLKGWYPTWCKRPGFTDTYLPTFNLPNVHLIDTNGKGVDSGTKNGIVVGGKEYPLDLLILSTGFTHAFEGAGNPAVRTEVDMYGRGGISLDEKWRTQGASTLHGMASNGFPNLFFQNPCQVAAAPNHLYSVDVWASHVAGVIAEAEKKIEPGSRAVIEVSQLAENLWGYEIMKHAPFYASVVGCTPSTLTSYGEFAEMPSDPAELMKKAKGGLYSLGMESYLKILEEYRADGSLKGIDVVSAVA